jgi:hypothetical protein
MVFPGGAVLNSISRRPGHIDLLGATADGALWIGAFDDAAQGSGWLGWTQVGWLAEAPPDPTAPAPAPAPASGPAKLTLGVHVFPLVPDAIDLFIVAYDGQVWTTRGDPDHWAGAEWRGVSQNAQAAPGSLLSSIGSSLDRRHLFAVGADGSVLANAWTSDDDWGAWQRIGDAGLVDVSRRQQVMATIDLALSPRRIELFVIDRQGRLITTSADEEGRVWAPWVPVGDAAVFAPQALVSVLGSSLDGLALVAPTADGGALFTVRAPGAPAFRPWSRLAEAGMLAASPRTRVSAASIDGTLWSFFVPGRDGMVRECTGTLAGGFGAWSVVEGLGGPVPANAVITAESWCRPGRVDLFVVRSDGAVHGAVRHGDRPLTVDVPPPPLDPPAQIDPPPPPPPPPPAAAGDAAPGERGPDPLAQQRAIAAARAAAAGVKRRRALLVGVNEYVDPNLPALKFCTNDVLALRDALRAAGYEEPVMLWDGAPERSLLPTRENIKVELMSLCESATPNDLLLVHFSCHGMLLGGQPHLMPANTRMKLLNETALAVDEVTRILSASAARCTVVLLDACHSGANFGRDGAVTPLSPSFVRNVYEQAQGMRILAGATSQQTACERDDRKHGAFTAFVIDGLTVENGFARADLARKGFVSFEDLKNYVTNGVIEWSRSERLLLQQPNDDGRSIGDPIVADFRSKG